LNESLRIPPKIGDIASTSSVGDSHLPTFDTEWACAYIPDLNIEPVTPHVVTGMIKDGKEQYDSGSAIRFQDLNNDGPLTMTTDIGGTCNLVAGNFIMRSIKSNLPEYLPRCMRGTSFDDNACDVNISPDVVSGVTTERCNDVVGTGRGGFDASINANKRVMNQFVLGVAYRVAIYPTPVTPLSPISDKRMDVPMQLQCNNGYSELHGSAPEGDAPHSIHCFDTGRKNSSFILLLQAVISNICKHPSQMLHMAIGTISLIVKRSYDLWISNAAIVRRRCRSMLMMYRPIDRGRHLERPQHC
jgi:hypothetical protein